MFEKSVFFHMRHETFIENTKNHTKHRQDSKNSESQEKVIYKIYWNTKASNSISSNKEILSQKRPEKIQFVH